MSKTKPAVRDKDDELLLQASDVPDSPAVLLIDLSSIAHPIWHMGQQEPDPDHTSQRTAAVVRSLAADHPHTAICCDSKSSFRKEQDSTYKANRPESEAPLHHQIDLAKEALKADGFPVYEVDGYEGDDLIATATRLLTATGERAVLIASADKDLLALVGEHVEVHSTRTGNRLGPDDVLAKLGVGPGLVVDYLTLVGDASDNIKGAKGIGQKSAVAMLTYFGGLDAVYSALDAGSASSLKPAQIISLDELRPRLEAVRSLVLMRTDVPLDIAAVFQPRVPTVVENFMVEESMEEQEMENEVLPESKPETVKPARTPLADYLESKLKPAKTGAGEDAASVSVAGVAGFAEPQPATAVAVVEQPAPDEWERSLEPRSMHEACLLAKRLHESHMFRRLRDAAGRPIHGAARARTRPPRDGRAAQRPYHRGAAHSLSAELMVALVLKSGHGRVFPGGRDDRQNLHLRDKAQGRAGTAAP